jgi:hypothetical protein
MAMRAMRRSAAMVAHGTIVGTVVWALATGAALAASPPGSAGYFTALPTGPAFPASFRVAAPLPTGQVVIAGATSSSLPDGQVLITGGGGSESTPSRAAYLFNPSTETFTALPTSGNTQMTVARDAPFSAPLPNGEILIAAGFSAASFTSDTAEVYVTAAEAAVSGGSFGDQTVPSRRPTRAQRGTNRAAAIARTDRRTGARGHTDSHAGHRPPEDDHKETRGPDPRKPLGMLTPGATCGLRGERTRMNSASQATRRSEPALTLGVTVR